MSETEDKNAAASRLVRNHMYASLAVGLVPVVWVDIVALTAVQLKMLRDLAKLYNVNFSSQLAQSAIGALLGGASVYSAVTVAKYIPLVGWLATLGSVSLFSGASTYAVGKVFTQHFASGGTFLTFDPQKVSDYYNQQLTQGRAEVKQGLAGVRP